MKSPVSRRGFLGTTVTTAVAAAGAGFVTRAGASPAAQGARSASFPNILRPPDSVTFFTDHGEHKGQRSGSSVWDGGGAQLQAEIEEGEPNDLRLLVRSNQVPVHKIRVRWHVDLSRYHLVLGDQWERAYGDLEWRTLAPDRAMPWYFVAYDGHKTDGFGIKTGARALCFWQADTEGITLWLDVRSGGVGVELNGRPLLACNVVSRRGNAGESAFAALQAFCRQMCPNPRLAKQPIYGINDWYYAYGNNTSAQILEDTKRLVARAPMGDNRPFSVVDAGWQPAGGADGGPWDRGNDRFSSMPDLAAEIKQAGARPGIWIRPLDAQGPVPNGWKLGRDHGVYDPTIPEVLGQVTEDISRLRKWGYELIKHDFSTVDILGRWGFQMGPQPVGDGWSFSKRDKTNAEIILDFYRTVRAAAGDALVIGCNTVSHLSAGQCEMARVGDDTSGQNWERTRKMGVNCLAFRAAQHNAFYAVDGDCVGLTTDVPWDLNRQWLDLLSRSGMPLFVSAQNKAVGAEQEEALKRAYVLAAAPAVTGEPLDWMWTNCPSVWRLHGETVKYHWFGPDGATPYGV